MNTALSSDKPATTVRAVLRGGVEFLRRAGVENPQLDAEVLLCHALGVARTALLVAFDDAVSRRVEEAFQSFVKRRSQFQPVAYITGTKEFWSLEFAVDANVLIPRPETELLVESALAYAKRTENRVPLRILDIGTGSGAIAVALATELRDARLYAVDISPAALTMARANARRHGVEERIQFLRGDLFDALGDNTLDFDLIVSNPPYIESGVLSELAPEIRLYEPWAALDGGADGLDYYRRIVAAAPRYLPAGGALLVEIGATQGKAIRSMLAAAGIFSPVVIYPDLAGSDRVIAVMKDIVCG